MTKSVIDNFEFFKMGARTEYPFVGYISSIDPTTARPGVLIGGSVNTYKTLLGTVKVRPGLKRLGTADATIAGVTSSYEWYTSLGETFALRVTEENKLQFLSDIADGSTLVWYDLMTGLDSTRFVFETWWNDTLKKDVLIMVKFDDNLYSWHGGLALFVSYAGGTITLDRDVAVAGFATSGSIIINGISYTYTGISGSTLTGTSDASAAVAGQPAYSAVVTTADKPAAGFSNDFIKVINNQLHVGSYDSRLVYVSAFDDFTDFTVPATRAPGDPDLLTLDSQARGITVQKGVTDRSGNAVVSGGLGDWYTVVRTDVTVGAALTEQVDVVRSQTADLSTALSHEFIEIIGDSVIFLDQNNQLRQFGLVRDIVNPVFPLLSLDVFTELQGRDFAGGHMRAVADQGDTTLYITCPLAGVDYMYQVRQRIDEAGVLTAERLWHPPQVRGLARVRSLTGLPTGTRTRTRRFTSCGTRINIATTTPRENQRPMKATQLLRICRSATGCSS